MLKTTKYITFMKNLSIYIPTSWEHRSHIYKKQQTDWCAITLTQLSVYRDWSFSWAAECSMQVNWPFVEMGFGQDSLLHQLEEELAHVVPCDLTALQGRLHPNTHKDVQLRAQVELFHTLDSLLQKTKKYNQDSKLQKQTGDVKHYMYHNSVSTNIYTQYMSLKAF